MGHSDNLPQVREQEGGGRGNKEGKGTKEHEGRQEKELKRAVTSGKPTSSFFCRLSSGISFPITDSEVP